MRLIGKIAALGMVGALALTACGRADDTATGSTPTGGTTIDDSPATGDISVWAMGTEGEKLPEFVKAFEADNPDATVSVTTIPWTDVANKVQTAVAAGTVPDAIMIGSSQMAMVASTGGLQQVPDGIASPDDFFSGAADSTYVDGVAYGVPWYVETRVLYYRSDIAAAAGVEAPTTWDEFTDFVAALQTQDGVQYGLQLPMGDAEDSTQVIIPFLSQAGGSVLNEAGDAYDLNTDAMVDALDFYASFFISGAADLAGYGDAQSAAFTNGTAPAMISGPWMVDVFAELEGQDWVDANVATAPVAAGSANNDSYIGGAHLGVFTDAKNSDGAWKLIKWLSQEDTQQAWYDLTNDLPALQSAWDYEPLTSNPRTAVLEEQLQNTIAPPAVPSYDELSGYIESEAEKVARQTTTAQDAAAAIQAKADSLGLGR